MRQERKVAVHQKVEDGRRRLQEPVMDFDPYHNGEQHHQGKASSRRLTQQGETEACQESQGTADLQKADEVTE